MKKILILLITIILSLLFNEKSNSQQALNERSYSTAISGLYVRKEPSSKADAIVLLKYNTLFTILEYSKTEETIGKIKAPWLRIKVINQRQTITGWVFGGFTIKNEPVKNSDLINNGKNDFLTIIKLLDQTCRLLLMPGPIGYLYFTGDRVIKENSFIQIDVPIGGIESKIEKIEYKNDSVILKIKRNTYNEDSIDSKISKTEFFKCNIPKKTVLDIYNKKKKDPEINCDLIK